jgi:hypothetical protein
MSLITAWGHYIPSKDIGTDYVIGVLWSVVLGFTILAWPVSTVNKKYLLWGWLAKVAVALGFMLLYENNYGLDSYTYYRLSTKAGTSLLGFAEFERSGSNSIIIGISKLHQMMFDSYHATKVSFAMIGFVGIFLFYRAAVIFKGRENKNIFYLFALCPSILFWSSTLGKEPLALLGIALYVYGITGFYKLHYLRYLAAMWFGIAIATIIREWLGPIMVLPLLILFLRGKSRPGLKIAVLLVVVIAIVLTAAVSMERLHIAAFQDVVTVANLTIQGYEGTPGGSTQNMNVEFNSVGSIIKFLPFGVFSALFRPLPGEVMNPFGLLSGAESLFLLVLLVRAIRRTRFQELKEPLVMWAVLFIVIWASVNGIVSSANMGLAARYKLQVMPLLLGVLIHLSRKRQKCGLES